MAGSCKPPKGQSVKTHWRKKARRKPTAAAKAAKLPWVVKDSRNGRIVSRHKHWTAAVNARKRRDLASYRRGQGRPYDVARA